MVRRWDGEHGTVVESWALYAAVLWDDGRRDEVDQFDPRVIVVQRARPE
jgi:hypothetical protein